MKARNGDRPSTYISYRSRYGIDNDILRIVNDNPVTKRRHKTGMGYAADLTYWLTVKYLRGLLDQTLLRISQDAGPYRHYEITPKGKRYLQVLAGIEEDSRAEDYSEMVTDSIC
jgi:predicted transcriptional regulator